MAAVQAAVEKFAKATVGEPSEFDCDVVVVGGGCAGLAAARFLLAKGWSCVVVEASDRLGGRVREATVSCGGDEVRVAAGAEFVHGADGNFLLPLLKDAGVGLEEASWPDSYWLGGAGALVAAADADRRPGLKKVHGAFEDVVTAHAPGESLLQYWVRAGVGSADLGVAEAVYANDYGGAASGLGAAEVAWEQRHWTHGEAYLLLETGATLSRAVGELATGVDARLGWAVASVYRDDRGVTARRTDGVMLRARRCVVAAPVAALRPRGGDPGVAFVPPLPPDLARAIDALPVANAVKAVVVLDRAVWADENWWNCVCGDALYPEFWRSGGPRGPRGLYVLVGFATGDRADAVAALGEAEATRRFLRQLDDVFGAADDPHPATNACVGSALFDWASETHARGGYTYPSPGCLPLRAAFREPVDGRLFFAGEHATEGINPCVQGAVDSGFRAGKLAHASLRGGAPAAAAAAAAARPRPARATRQVRGPRVKCDLNGWREESPRKPRNGFDAAVTALPQFDVAIGDSTPLRHSKTSAKFPWNSDGAGSPSPRAPGTTAWGPHVDHPRERETMAPGRSPPRPPWHEATPVSPGLRLPRGLAEDDLPAFYH